VFIVIFEVNPREGQTDAYLGLARALKPELEQIEGFVDVVRYRSLTRKGWILSLSSWRDEKALVRWRTHAKHHKVQERGRTEVFGDYRLRVGEISRDTQPPDGFALREMRFDETQAGDATTATLIAGKRPPEWVSRAAPSEVAKFLGFDAAVEGLVAWDVFDAVLTPGDVILLSSWRSEAAARASESAFTPPADARSRRVRIIRDYGMFERGEAPQYYPDVKR
jgi:heme-degrading monooxygenase HmoA